MQLSYTDVFNTLHPGFFEKDYIRNLPAEDIFDEQIMVLSAFDPTAVNVPCPPHITFGEFTGDIESLKSAVREVDEDWVQYFNKGDHVYCAFDGDKVASFCLLDDFGEYKGLRVGAPGCVGTVPAYRRQGIGLKMVQNATQILKEKGYDLSWIHYTQVGHWYAKLGYETVLRWNCRGIAE